MSKTRPGRIAAAINKPGAEGETNVTFRVTRRMYNQLKAAGGDAGMSEEIRRRLDLSLRIEDKATEQLLEAIAEVTGLLARDGQWHQDPFLHRVLVCAVTRLLDDCRPEEPLTPRRHTLLDPDANAETVGRLLAALVLPVLLKDREDRELDNLAIRRRYP